MRFAWFKQSQVDTTPKLFQLGDYRRIDTSSLSEGLGAACGYCRTDLWLGNEKSVKDFAETQLDSRFLL